MFHLCVGIAANRLECPKGHSILIFTIFLKNQVKLRNLCRTFAKKLESLDCIPKFCCLWVKIFLDLLLFFFYFKAYGWDGACGEEA